MRYIPVLVTAFLSAAMVAPACAQELTDAQLLELFNKQRDAFRAARESTTGRTRGLTLITVDDVAVATESPGLSQPDAGEASAGVSATDTGGVTVGALSPLSPAQTGRDQGLGTQETAAPQQVVFGSLAPELQINVHIRFAFDSAALSSDQLPQLEQLCTVMSGSDIELFRIVGHTDASGSFEYNERLSQLRAEEVQRYLVRDCGIAPGRLEAVGLGERFLADEVDPKAAENRRVEFQALS
ncbi:Outer membrane porin F [Defluviimonas aquaemixtae]|uniref:Outer membrane porin F n=1 Tax=Albidovulum aquaemixtae TaxID=1542388 RepID=A0A2R8B7R5_9RHOB|nr:OmpA family protein [Defluviimonas aquaemixtae]SPH18685.1 Outer membrane porin F [Defluviimonas aquaemixtae]